MDFTKGYTTENGEFIPEGTNVEVTLLKTGEVLTGILLKASVNEFRLLIGSTVTVHRVGNVNSMQVVED